MDNQLLTGKLTRLVAGDPDTVAELFTKWARDTEFQQLWDTDVPVVRDLKRTQESFRKDFEKERPGGFGFIVQRLEDNRNIGLVGLWDAFSPHHNAWVSIGIGERDLWSKGYGGDAMNLILRFGFKELNLHRVNLFTFAINPRAIRSYLKVGFVEEGRQRKAMNRWGKRDDYVFMGILRDEWERKQNES